MPNANFITQFEYRLNNLTGSETQAELLSLRATADKYPELDIAAVALLDAAIDLDADTLTNSSTIKELVTVGNADAEISGGSVYTIGESRSLYIDDPTGMVDIDGETWLRHGVIDDDIASYPDAKVGGDTEMGSVDYTGTSFSTSANISNANDMCWDGSHFWIVQYSGNAVYKFTHDGTYTGVNFSVAAQDSKPYGITWDGTNFWVVGDNNNRVYQYLPDGTYTGVNFSVNAQEANPKGITWDGTHLWVVGSSDDTMYQYSVSGSYTGTSFSVVNESTSSSAILWDGSHFWIGDENTYSIYQYTAGGEYTGVKMSMPDQTARPTGVCWDATHFWVCSIDNSDVLQYLPTRNIEYVGTPYADTDINTGSPMYMRIK